ncbi:unnamed protein product [Ixodes persulcatus]
MSRRDFEPAMGSSRCLRLFVMLLAAAGFVGQKFTDAAPTVAGGALEHWPLGPQTGTVLQLYSFVFGNSSSVDNLFGMFRRQARSRTATNGHSLLSGMIPSLVSSLSKRK